ncbi:MAG: PilZ domain-containing protein [Kofleriaceae bacterium]
MAANARSATRVTVEAFVIVRAAETGDAELVFRTRDLSATGLFLYTRVARTYPLRIGSTLAIEFHDEAASFRCTGVVARVVEAGSAEADRFPTGFGVRIVGAEPDDRARLDGLLASLTP